MTDLQLGLIILGVLLVLAVFAYNQWQERSHRKMAEHVFQQPPSDVLMETKPPTAPDTPASPDSLSPSTPNELLEPVLASEEIPSPPVTPVVTDETFPNAPITPTLTEEVVETTAPAPSLPEVANYDVAHSSESEIENTSTEMSLPDGLLSPQVDCIVVLDTVEPVPASTLLYFCEEMVRRISKPMFWVAYNEARAEWEVVSDLSTNSYRFLRLGLQLVDRRGAISENELNLFSSAVKGLADQQMAIADMPPSRTLLQSAQALDAFCAEVDLQIGINLVTRSAPFPGTKIRGVAEAAGLVLTSNGAFTRYDEQGNVQFTVVNLEPAPFSSEQMRTMSTHGMTFLLDIPKVAHGERVFMQMTDLARRLADSLNGVLVDDNHHPLADVQLEQIRRDFVGKTQAAMTAEGIPAGSALALRVFA